MTREEKIEKRKYTTGTLNIFHKQIFIRLFTVERMLPELLIIHWFSAAAAAAATASRGLFVFFQSSFLVFAEAVNTNTFLI